MPKIVGGKDWAERVVDNARKTRFAALDPHVKHMNATSQLRAAASPYEVTLHEDMSTYDIKITLTDKRQKTAPRMVVKIPRGAMSDMSVETIMKAVVAAKSRLQKKLAENCDEPELRLWAAEFREVDLMDNSEIPSRIRIAYDKQKAIDAEVDRLARQRSEPPKRGAVEMSIESDNGPVRDTPPPPRRKVVKRRPRPSINLGREFVEESKNVHGESTEPIQGEETQNVPVAKVKGAHSKTPVRKPRCNNRDHDDAPEMVFDPEDGVWKCPEPGCKTIARPKSDSPVGQVQLGKGRLDLRVLFVEPGKKPSVLLVSDNNIALDITDYITMDNFLKYSRAVQKAQEASNNGEKMVQVDMPAEKFVSAMLKFPGMRIYGCDNA